MAHRRRIRLWLVWKPAITNNLITRTKAWTFLYSENPLTQPDVSKHFCDTSSSPVAPSKKTNSTNEFPALSNLQFQRHPILLNHPIKQVLDNNQSIKKRRLLMPHFLYTKGFYHADPFTSNSGEYVYTGKISVFHAQKAGTPST